MSTAIPDDAPKVLYIDDNPLNRSLVKRLLQDYGFEFIEAATGLEGIIIAQKERPDLILMDINMPGLDGHETTTRMRGISILQNTPIIAVTARTTRGERELALVAGCDGYIPKPIDVDQFPQQIVSYLNGYRDTLSSHERSQYLDQYSHKLVDRLEAKIMELKEANTRLRKIDKMKSDFITLAAHELRTPLSVVYGYAGILQSMTAVDTFEEVQMPAEGSVGDLAYKIYEATHRLSEVVNDILNISLVAANEVELAIQPIILLEVVQAALNELNPLENGRDLNIVFEDMENLPFLLGDVKKMQQVFFNILSNAIKYTPDGGTILIRGEIVAHEAKSQTDQATDILLISIKDSGIGLNESDKEVIFEQFYVVADTTYHRSSKTAFGGGGMGLGLPIAKGIIEAHGGQIWADSEGTDKGSTFFIRLPLEDLEEMNL